MLKKHVSYTNSAKAKMIIDNFDEEVKKIVKVLPVDFKNVLLSKSNNYQDKSKEESLWQK